MISAAVNSKKVEDSNQKRLDSMKEKLDEFKKQKSMVRASLNDLDAKAKKIVFDSDDDSDEGPSKNEVKKPRLDLAKTAQSTTVKKPSSKKKLLSSDSDSSDSEQENRAAQKKKKSIKASKDEEETIKMFESKINLDEKKANKLMNLKTKYSNEDSRFKIDDRFVADDFDEEEAAAETTKPTTKEQLRSENLSSMKILENITGRQLIRPSRVNSDGSAIKPPTAAKNSMNKIVRYDPSKNDHKVYELKDSSSSEEEGASSSSVSSESSSDDDDDDGKAKAKKAKAAKPNVVAKTEGKKIEEDLTKFYKMEPNLKELFSSNDVFKFKFTNEEDHHEPESGFPTAQSSILATKSAKYSFLDDLNFNNGRPSKKDKYFNSSESESESSENEEDDEKKKEVTVVPRVSKPLGNGRTLDSRPGSVVTSFLPDFEQDKRLKEALEYFHRKENVDQLKEEWVKSRESLVKEYKKKHKRMLRIKKTKENEKLLPWKLSNSNSNKRKKH